MKNKEYQKKYQKENKEHIKQLMKKNYKENKRVRKHYTRVYTSEKKMTEKYNRPIKNIIRERIITESKNCKNILTLESKDFLFSKLIPEKKVYVFENDKEEYNLMLKTKPKNVILSYGDISNFKEYDMDIDLIYLDFCSTYLSSKETIYLLKEKIRNCKIFAVTFCTWDETKEPNGDYQFELIRNLQELTNINWKVLFGQGYRDKGHSTMVTIILENSKC
jgi:hypothetical protein